MSDTETAGAAERAWSSASLANLMEHIIARHHAFLREELPAIDAMIAQFTRSEATARRIPPLRASFRQFRGELEGHLQKEEIVLFPLIAKIEGEVSLRRKAPRQAFGSIANPIGVMELEHEFARRSLRLVRAIIRDDPVFPDAAESRQVLEARLTALEFDLETHSKLEDEILFPRVIEMEVR